MDKYFFDKGSAMQRILAILEQVANSDRPVTPTEINEKLKEIMVLLGAIIYLLQKKNHYINLFNIK